MANEDIKNKPSFYGGIFQPKSDANTDKGGNSQPTYPNVQGTFSKSGHSLQLDDTKGRERVRLEHRTGTFIEMSADGGEVHKVYGDGYEITVKNKEVHIGGECKIYIEKDADLYVGGNLAQHVEGNYELYVGGNMTQSVVGITNINSQNDLVLQSGGLLGGAVRINTGDHLHLNGDLVVDGEMTATKVFSKTRVDALVGMSAGGAGYVTSGGISVGLPTPAPAVPGVDSLAANLVPMTPAIPGTINAFGPITSLTSVAAPLGTFGISSSFLAFDVVNLLLHNTHIHPSPKGPTGTPIPLEVA